MKQLLICITLLLSNLILSAQGTLSIDEFLHLVRRYHPVAKQAALGVDIAKAELTSARGEFDPTFESTIGRKEFDGLLYYDHRISAVNVPTWYGVEVVAGIESLSGERTLAPDTKGASSYLGFSVPVAKGALIDERRAALKQAKVFQDLSVQEQRAIINDLLYEATKAYWSWWQQVQVARLFDRAVKNAEERFSLVKKTFLLGERPAIDTTESLAQLQSFQMTAKEIELALVNAQLDVSAFLWKQNEEAYNLPKIVTPGEDLLTRLEGNEIDSLVKEVTGHPELQQYHRKLKALTIEKKLKFQSLLPSVYLKYNQLNKSHNLQKSFSTPWLQNNYRYGVTVSLPLRLSEGRGEYSKTKLKIEQNKLAQLNKQTLLQTKLKQYYNERMQLQQQIALQKQAVQSYVILQRGEEIKFRSGESSLFLVNARELKTFEAQQKLLELQSKEQKANASLLWAMGKLGAD